MFGAPGTSGLTLGKVIGGISKTLSVANQIIPLYKQAKPMISNAKTILGVLKDFNKSDNKSAQTKTNNTQIKRQKKETPSIREVKSNQPQFFL